MKTAAGHGGRMTAQAQAWLRPVLSPGDWVLDATAGRGRDTLFLAQAVAPGGRLWAVDVQEAAVAQTERVLQELAPAVAWQVLRGDHAELAAVLARAGLHEPGTLRAAMFNLGYLPGGPTHVTTQAASTMAALPIVERLLQTGGRLTVVAYPGHPGGREETEAVAAWVRCGVAQGRWHQHPAMTTGAPPHAPQGFFLQKLAYTELEQANQNGPPGHWAPCTEKRRPAW